MAISMDGKDFPDVTPSGGAATFDGGDESATGASWQQALAEARLDGGSPAPSAQPRHAPPPVAGFLALLPPASEALGAGAATQAGSAWRLPPVLALPLLLKGDTAPPHANLAGHEDLRLDLSDSGHVTISRNDGALFGIFPGTKLITLGSQFHDTPEGVQGRVFDDQGRTLGTFQNGTLHLTPEADAALSALAGGAGGAPPGAGSSEAAGCEDPAKGEPGRSAGRQTLAQRDPVPPALQADSARARDIVRQTDPAIAAAGLGDKDWVAHHLITREAAGSDKFDGLFDAASKAGWQSDSAENLIGLPTNCPAQEKLQRQGVSRPEHVGSHPTWNGEVAERLSVAKDRLESGSLMEGSPNYNSYARSLLEAIQKDLRRSLGKMDRVTLIDEGDSHVPV